MERLGAGSVESLAHNLSVSPTSLSYLLCSVHDSQPFHAARDKFLSYPIKDICAILNHVSLLSPTRKKCYRTCYSTTVCLDDDLRPTDLR